MPQTPASLLRYADCSIAVPGTQLTASNPFKFSPDAKILSADVPDGQIGVAGLKRAITNSSRHAIPEGLRNRFSAIIWKYNRVKQDDAKISN